MLRDGGLLGRMIDTFVLAQIRPEVALSSFRPRLYHLRSAEIDLVAELSAGDVVAVEIKSTGAPTRGDARHLEWRPSELLGGPHRPASLPALRARLRAADRDALGVRVAVPAALGVTGAR